MSNDPIIELQGKNIALVAMGQSQIDFHLSQTHSVEFDEIWAINAMIGVLPNIDAGAAHSAPVWTNSPGVVID